MYHKDPMPRDVQSLATLFVCTDSEKIGKVCNQYNAKWIMTSKKHINGTERIAEAAKKFPKSNKRKRKDAMAYYSLFL